MKAKQLFGRDRTHFFNCKPTNSPFLRLWERKENYVKTCAIWDPILLLLLLLLLLLFSNKTLLGLLCNNFVIDLNADNNLFFAFNVHAHHTLISVFGLCHPSSTSTSSSVLPTHAAPPPLSLYRPYSGAEMEPRSNGGWSSAIKMANN